MLTTGKPQAKEGVQSDLLGTTRRNDGATQVTYAGHPLYFYAHEGKYQVLCHNIEEIRRHLVGRPARRRPRPSLDPAMILWPPQRVDRQELGASPVSRLNARLNASSES